ncbi:rod shape-determining protein RodA [bacterium]|nr:rod shape-determining protein RodA [bacterium]MBU1983682.1 rod shape-determining protein RodA [bacterium]
MQRPLWGLDLRVLGAVIVLTLVGLIANFSTSFAEGALASAHFYRQLIWVAAGLVIMVIVAAVEIRYIQLFASLAYGLGIVALLAVLVIGQTQMGAKRWINLGAFQLQPSEAVKITTLLGLARLISGYPREAGRAGLTFAALAMTIVPTFLILIEPDLGTALVFPMMMFCMLGWGGVPLWHLLLIALPVIAVITSWNLTLHALALLGLLVALFLASRRWLVIVIATVAFVALGAATPALWNHLHPYQQKRLLTFVNPEADPLGSAYQIIQSKIAVGSGGMTGKGFLSGTQTQLKFLPEGHTDFIFSAWGEQFGFLGSALVLLLFFTIFYQGIRLAARCHNPFHSLVAAGIVSLLTLQVLLNMFMTVGLLPVTGVPLPFISYGGSSLLTWMTMAGLLLGVSMRWREY